MNTIVITSNIANKVDGAYTRMLRAALNTSWRVGLMRNKELYDRIPKITVSIRE